MQKVIRKIVLFGFVFILILSTVSIANAMLWDNGYGEMKGGVIVDRITTTYKNSRSVLSVMGLLSIFILLFLSFIKNIRKKCWKISKIIFIFLIVVWCMEPVIKFYKNKHTPVSTSIEDTPAKSEPEICYFVRYDGYFDESGFIGKIKALDNDELLNTTCANNEPLLSRSAYNGWDRAVDLLLNKGVDVNARGYKGNTALHWAFLKLDYLKNCTRDDCPEKREKYRNIIKLLIKHRASQTILNDELKTPEQAKMKY